MPLACGLQREEPLGLPLQDRVGHALERLAHHDQLAVLPARGQVDVGQPSLPAPAAPLHRDHHEVGGAARLDLHPAGATATRGIRRLRVLDHDPLVPARHHVVEERLRGVGIAGQEALHHERRRQLGQRRPPLMRRLVDEVAPVQVQQVEEVCRHRRRARQLGRVGARGGPGTGDLERLGPTVLRERDDFAVEHGLLGGERADRLDHLGQPVGDLLQAPGEQPHRHVRGAVEVGLQPDPVELEIEGDLGRAVDRRGDVGLGARQHRTQGPPHLQPDRLQRRRPFGERRSRHRPREAREHDGAADQRLGHVRRLRDGRQHHPVARPLAQLPGDEPREPGLLLLRRPGEEVADGRGPFSARALATDRLDPAERGVDLEHRQRRGLRRVRPVAQPAPADPDGPLRQRAGEVVRHHLDLPVPVGAVDSVGALAPGRLLGGLRQGLRQQRGLGRARAGRGDLGGRAGDGGELHTGQCGVPPSARRGKEDCGGRARAALRNLTNSIPNPYPHFAKPGVTSRHRSDVVGCRTPSSPR